jgi:hypothetical protein
VICFSPSDAGRRASARLGFLRAPSFFGRSGRAVALAALRAGFKLVAALILIEISIDLAGLRK